ncbi:TatD family hydrolase [Aquella oligotrophica]|uniref:Uncharacterized protein n=1 Tax=Aquella oligotrophica TaxID=2067065 RepID=A0A2I7N835_9NEIS|nr:TatD family hydrolase [Aquella oligotrophica]AUR52395.1 hypothetical protein CUN60_08820 [Aquella oligotrophica]
MLIYDSHCHLEAIKNDPRQTKIAIPAILPEDIEALFKYRKRNPYAKIGLGLHPWYANKFINYSNENFNNYLEQLIVEYQPDFIGECGLDKNKPEFELQQKLLHIHLELAKKHQKPVVLHSVRATNELLSILKQYKNLRGIVHAFNGNSETAKQLLRFGFYLGIGSLILNPESQLSKSIEKIPLSQIILETDAPYMPPYEVQYSHPYHSLIYAERITQLKKIALREVISSSNTNWNNLFIRNISVNS